MFSSRMLNNLFFNNNDITLEEIQQFMLTKNNCQSILENFEIDPLENVTLHVPLQISKEIIPIVENTIQNTIENTIQTNSINILNNIPIIKTPIPEKKEKYTSFLPRQQDTLFWCIFIIVNGFNEYNEIQRNYGVVELEIKKKIADYLKDNSSNMKQTNYKITKIKIQEIMSELLTSQKMTSYECLLAMCVFYKINIAIIFSNDKIMTEFISSNDEETPFYILNKDSYGKYKVDTVKKTWKEIQEIKQTRVCLDNYLKPMKSISNYTIPNLEELATKLGIFDITKKYKKQELYELINSTINPVITNTLRT